MADLTLNKPAAGAQNVINAEPDSRIELNFPTDQATLERSGNDLVFHFDDGSSIVIRDFYTAYTKESMPDFVLDGTPISGEQFFTALNGEDLMPAAGPAANAGNADGGRFHEFSDDPLQTGVDRLDGLDLSSSRAFFPERDPWGGLRGGPVNNAPTISATGSIDLVESGVHPGGNDPYAGIPSQTGTILAADADGDALNFGFIAADGSRVTEITTEYGTIVMSPDGTYTYTIDNDDPDTNSLALGETREQTFTVYVDDGRGGVATQEITVTITGTNDRPELALSAGTLEVIESGVGRDAEGNVVDSNIPAEENASYSGKFTSGAGQAQGTDADHGAVLTYGVAGGATGEPQNAYFTATNAGQGHSSVTAAGTYGDLILNNDGSYTYTLRPTGDADLNSLHEGEIVTETFTVYVKDEHGAWTSRELSVNITGTNDRPEISHVESLVLKESGVQDGGNTPTTPDGTVESEGGAHRLTATGHVTADDVDNDDDAGTLHYSFANGETSVSTELGSVTIDQNGNYTYTLNDKAANSLAQGETRTETITVMVTDSHGATHEAEVNVTIYGTNDRPVLSVDGSGQTLDEGNPGDAASVSGTFGVLDPDSDAGREQHFHIEGTPVTVDGKEHVTTGQGSDGTNKEGTDNDVSASFTTDYGKLVLDPTDNTWKYELDNDSEAVQKLNAGETKVEHFTVTVTDEHGATSTQDITVTITGTNDNPIIDAGHSTLNLEFKEEGVYQPEADGDGNAPTQSGGTNAGQHQTGTLSGKVLASDVDTENGAGSTDHSVNKLDFHVEHKGSSLSDGGSSEDVTGTDGTPSGDVVYTYTSAYGTLTFHANGSYEYTLKDGTDGSDAVNHLALGQTVTETFTVSVTDAQTGKSEPQDITITIRGTNDKPTLSLENDNFNGITGGEGLHVVESGVGREDANTPTDDPAKENVAFEGRVTDTGTASGADADAGHILYFGAAAGNTAEDGFNPDVFNKADSTATGDLASSKTVDGQFGQLVLNSDGSYTYTMKGEDASVGFDIDGRHYDSLNALNEGDTITETFTIYVRDEHNAWTAQPVTVTIHGTNDRPVLGIEKGDWNITQGGELSVEGKFGIEDADQDAGTHQTITIANGGSEAGGNDTPGTGTVGHIGENEGKATYETDYGTLTLHPDGTWAYEAKADAVKGLGKDETKVETFEVTVTDEHGATSTDTITVTLTGTNDAPHIGYTSIELKEDGVYDNPSAWVHDDANTGTKEQSGGTWIDPGHHKTTIDGKLEATDADLNDTLTYGINGLATSQMTGGAFTDKLEITIDDSDPQAPETVTVSILSNTKEGNIQTIVTNYGTLVLHTDTGEFTFTLGGDADKLAQGEELRFNFRTTVDDGNASDNHMMGVLIKGTNDRPTLNLTVDDASGSIGPDGAVHFAITETPDAANDTTVSGTVIGKDVDRGADLSYGVVRGSKDVDDAAGRNEAFGADAAGNAGMGDPYHMVDGKIVIEGDYGTLTIDPTNGTYTYTTNANADSLGLKDDGNGGLTPETGTDEFTVYVRDEHGAWSAKPITVTVSGSNDTPTAELDDSLSLKEAGVWGEADPNAPTAPNTPTESGSTPSENTHVESVTGKITAHDTDANDTVTLDLGTGAASEIKGDPAAIEGITDAVGEVTDGTYPGTDQSAQVITTTFGTLYFNPATGDYTYVLHTNDGADTDAVNRLPQGATVTEHFTITVSDGKGGTVAKDLTITIEGTNERPDIWHGENANAMTDGDGTLVFDSITETNGGTRTVIDGKVIASDADNDNGAGTDTATSDSTGLAFSIVGMTGQSATHDSDKNVTSDPAESQAGSVTTDGGFSVIETQYGTLRVDTTTGEYTYTLKESDDPDNPVNALGEGQTITETYTIRVTDGHGAYRDIDIKVSVNGANDAPVISEGSGHLVYTEAGVIGNDQDGYVPGKNTPVDTSGNTLNGSVGATDVDSGDTLTYFFTDEKGKEIDPRLLKGMTIGTLTREHHFEDGSSYDPDHPEVIDITVTNVKYDGSTIILVTKYGEFRLDTTSPEGKYTFKPTGETGKGAINALQHGDTVELNLTIGVKDQHGQPAENTHDVNIVINGSNDAPTYGGSSVKVKESGVKNGGNEAEPGKPEGSDTNTHTTDYDSKELTYTINATHTAGKYSQGEVGTDANGWATYKVDLGTFHLDPKTGDYYFELDNDAANSLHAGQNVERYLQFKITDEHGAFVNTWVTAKIEGTNDAPEFTLHETTSGFEGTFIKDGVEHNTSEHTDKGDLYVKEDANNESGSVATGEVHATDVDNDNKDGKDLRYGLAEGTLPEGAKVVTTYTYKDAEGHEHKLITEFTDQYGGTFKIDPTTGEYSYTIDNANPQVQELHEGDTLDTGITITVWDKHSATDTHDITVTIVGTHDAPVFTADGWNGVAKESGVVMDNGDGNTKVNGSDASGMVSATDRDDGDKDKLTYEMTAANNKELTDESYSETTSSDGQRVQHFEGEYGTFTFNTATREWTYTVDQIKTQHLAQGESVKESFSITVTDPSGLTDTKDVTITVQGTNDKPKITGGVDGEGSDLGTNDAGQLVINIDENEPGKEASTSGRFTGEDDDTGMGTDGKFLPGAGNENLRFSVVDKDGNVLQTLEGEHGRLELQENGSYKYILTEDMTRLSNGETATDTFKVRVTDSLGAYSEQEITIVINGQDDTFTVTNTEATVSEDFGNVVPGSDGKLPSVTETLEVKDPDTSDTHEFGNTAGDLTFNGKQATVNNEDGTLSVEGDHGVLVFDPATGRYTYTLTHNNEPKIQELDPGEELKETFTVKVTSGGATQDATITITIKGTNDAPELTGWTDKDGATGSFNGESKIHIDETTSEVTGTFHATDIDKGDVGNTEAGTGNLIYGFLTVELGGKHVLVAADADGGYHLVNLKGEPVDADGNSVADPVTEIDGKPITSDAVETVNSYRGEYGTLYIDRATGKYTYVLDTETSAVKDLNDDQTAGDSFVISVTDQHGASSTQTITVEIKGDSGHGGGETPPAPNPDVVPSEQTVQEDQKTTTAGSIIKEDGETDGARFVLDPEDPKRQSISDEYGTLKLDPTTGKYTYELHNDTNIVQRLNEGDEPVERTYKVYDANGHEVSTITIYIEGTNDAPVVHSTTAEAPVHETHLTVEGTVTASDVDEENGGGSTDHAKNHLDFSFTEGKDGTGIYGELTLNSDGSYSYTLNPDSEAYKKLAVGETKTETFTVQTTDAQGVPGTGTITITITGTNDQPVIKSAASLDVKEDGIPETSGEAHGLIAKGEVVASDVDGDTLHYSAKLHDAQGNGSTVVQGKYGTLIINQDGTYTYRLDNNKTETQELGARGHESDTEHFDIIVSDGKGDPATQSITVTVHGTNDAPVLSVDSALSVTESTDPVTITGQSTVYDVDKGDSHTFTITDADGNSLLPNPDGSYETKYGTVSIDENGNYTYTLDPNKAASLKEGQQEHDVFKVVVTDGAGASDSQPVDVTVTGTNTAPTLTLTDISVTEGISGAVTETAKGGDADSAPENLTYSFLRDDGTGSSLTLHGKYGTITIDPRTGKYTYTPDMDTINGLGLGEGQTLHDLGLAEETFTVQVKDEYGAVHQETLHVNITGTNDAPVITSEAPVFDLTESADGETSATIGGQIDITDADKNADDSFFDTHTYTVKLESDKEGTGSDRAQGQYGTLIIDENGHYTYTLTSDELGEGEKATETFTVMVSDGHETVAQTITVNLTGTNDAPVIETTTAAGSEGTLTFSDADVSDTHSITVSLDGHDPLVLDGSYTSETITVENGTLTLTYDPETKSVGYTLTPNDGVSHNQTVDASFSISVNDGTATVETSTPITLRAQGTANTAPTTGTAEHATDLPSDLLVGAEHVANGTLSAQDADGDTLTFTPGELPGDYGTLTINADGTYTYTLNTSAEALQTLNEHKGQTLTDTFAYGVSDGHGGKANGEVHIELNVPETFQSEDHGNALTAFSHASGGEEHAAGVMNADDHKPTDADNADQAAVRHTDSGVPADAPDAHQNGTADTEPHASDTPQASTLTEELRALNGETDDHALGRADAADTAGHAEPSETTTSTGHDAGTESHALNADVAGTEHPTDSAEAPASGTPGAHDQPTDAGHPALFALFADGGDDAIFGTDGLEALAGTDHAGGFYSEEAGVRFDNIIETDQSLDAILPSVADTQASAGTDVSKADLSLTENHTDPTLAGADNHMPGVPDTAGITDAGHSDDGGAAIVGSVPDHADHNQNLAEQLAQHTVANANGH